MKFLDIHCHIVPGVDDGARSSETAMNMLRMEYDEGVRNIYLTPHYVFDHNRYTYDTLEDRFAHLCEKAAAEFPDMELRLGNEIYYEPYVIDMLRDGDIHTMGGSRYILTEFATSADSREILTALRQYTSLGYKVIIAHAERYGRLAGNLDAIDEVIDSGAELQCNTQAVTAGMFDAEGRWARRLVMTGRVTYIGTDAHNTHERKPEYRKCAEWIMKKVPGEYAERVLNGNIELGR